SLTFHTSSRTNNIRFAVALNVICATADIVRFDSLHNLVKRKSIGSKTNRIGLHLKLLDKAADCIGTGDTRDRAHLRPDDPVLHRTQVNSALEIVSEALSLGRKITAVALPSWLAVANLGDFPARRIFHRPPVDFAEPSGDRAHLHLGSRR